MIYKARASDIAWMVKLSHEKRLNYSKMQPLFWKMAADSDLVQEKYFLEEINKNNVIALCFEGEKGFVIGKIVKPPEVYDAKLTLMIDDFCVKTPDLWIIVGLELLNKIKSLAKEKGVGQILVVCGNCDLEKSKLLEKINLDIASKWHVGEIC